MSSSDQPSAQWMIPENIRPWVWCYATSAYRVQKKCTDAHRCDSEGCEDPPPSPALLRASFHLEGVRVPTVLSQVTEGIFQTPFWRKNTRGPCMWPGHLLCVFWKGRRDIGGKWWRGTESFPLVCVAVARPVASLPGKERTREGEAAECTVDGDVSHQLGECGTLLKAVVKAYSLEGEKSHYFKTKWSWKPKILIIKSFLGS